MKGEFKVSTVNGADVSTKPTTSASRAPSPPSMQTVETTHLFAGAKRVSVSCKDYQKALGIPHFDDSVDWGWLWFLTRPMFFVLDTVLQAVRQLRLGDLRASPWW